MQISNKKKCVAIIFHFIEEKSLKNFEIFEKMFEPSKLYLKTKPYIYGNAKLYNSKNKIS